jgi:aspartate/methionine/tyrosine aminotransferase
VTGFVPPPYPYDRLNRLTPITEAHAGGTVDLSIGTPFDPPPTHVIEALSSSGTERSYPPSIGTLPLREAAGRWIRRRFDVDVPAGQIGATIGSKEFVATLPQWMRLRTPIA